MARKLVSTISMRVLFILLTALSLNVSAQKIEFGEEFNNVGVLKKPGTEWTTDSWPKMLAIMYYNGKTTINGNAMNILVTSTTEEKETTDSVKLVIGQARNWAALRYDFKAENVYTVSAYDRLWTFLASGTVTVKGPKKPEPKPEPKPVVVAVEEPKIEEPVVEVVEEPKIEEPVVEAVPTKKAEVTKERILESAPEPVFVESVVVEELTEEEKETLMFESFYIAFGRNVQSGMLQGQNEKFKAVPGGVNASVLFSNNEGFGTDVIAVDVWHKPKGAANYDEHYANLNVTIPKNTQQADFKLLLEKRGSYKVSLYTGGEDSVWIGSGYVSLY